MGIVKKVQIRDYFLYLDPQTTTFKVVGGIYSTSRIAQNLLLNQRTARTNVMLRDSKGRFVSYRKLGADGDDGIIGTTMAILKPFPVGYAF